MIFVTVGTHDSQFDRLLKELDVLIERGKIKDKIVAQIGRSTYIPKNYEWFRFLEFEKIIELQKRADFIVSHGGVGSIMNALQLKKAIVVVPRLPEYKEHLDRHQVQTTKELEKEGRVIAVYDLKNLDKALIKARTFKPKQKNSESRILQIVAKYLAGLEPISNA